LSLRGSFEGLCDREGGSMKTTLFTIILAALLTIISPVNTQAAPDQYAGDTSIYGGATAGIEPNVLIIMDTSGSMEDTVPGDSYYPSTAYGVTNNCDNGDHTHNCISTAVYSATGPTKFINDVSSVTTSCNGLNPYDLLTTTGQYNGRRLNSSGSCRTSGNGQYQTGNYINYLNTPGLFRPKIQIAREVMTNLVNSTNGIRFGLMTYSNVSGNGGQFRSSSVSGSTYITTVKAMNDIFTGTTTNRSALTSVIASLTTNGITPLGESLFEAMRYFRGGQSAFGNTIGLTGGYYTTPIIANCQKNYVIVVTDGMANADDDPVLRTICNNGDCDGDGQEPGNLDHILDDVAKYMYDHNLISGATGSTNNVRTYTIGFGDIGADPAAVALLTRTADTNHGHGQTFLATNASQLSAALTQVIGQIFQVDTSFVAPVVPVSPENRTYSGSRIYMGFFKPINMTYWAGNLKKYAIDSNNNLRDMNASLANYTDLNGDGYDDNDNTQLPPGAINGTFRLNSRSFWSSGADAGEVDEGGVGDVLLNRTTARNLYTYVSSTSANLTDTSNALSTTNSLITAATLSVASTADKDNLINFLNGLDSYDEDTNSITNEKRSWIFNDILHSKPLVVNYAAYDFTTTNEADCSVNKTMIFIGDNDGMLHAFNDCDGSEAWAFAPPDVLANLKFIPGSTHTYFVDSSASVYIYDRNHNGTIETDVSNGDKVILILGLRRGGGSNVVPTTGMYYALDVSDPVNPVYLWKLSNASSPSGVNTDYAELGESWSEPRIGRMKIGSSDKIVAFIGGGYDNLNEDSRYGNTQTFTGTGTVTMTESGGNNVTSTGTAAPNNPKGRAIYAVEIATLDTIGTPSFVNSGWKVWGYTNSTNMTFAIPSETLALDTNFDGYVDRLYIGDTGGNVWRVDMISPSTGAWTVNRIFSTDPGADATNGRKIFYKMSAIIEQLMVGSEIVPQVTVYFGTGDRVHPLNTAIVDRFYSVIDKQQTTANNIREGNLMDVTLDQLQTTTIQTGPGSVADILSRLTATTNYGWYIKLDQNSGEKVLAPPVVLNGVVYFTTFAPGASVVTDPCQPGNLGTGRMYAVDYKTGEAVLNYDRTNDSQYSTLHNASTGNARATGVTGQVLQRNDRQQTIGNSIPSGVVLVVSASGETALFVGSGGAMPKQKPRKGGAIVQEYWRQR
jgi:type IV pilus assembly protein PilY1